MKLPSQFVEKIPFNQISNRALEILYNMFLYGIEYLEGDVPTKTLGKLVRAGLVKWYNESGCTKYTISNEGKIYLAEYEESSHNGRKISCILDTYDNVYYCRREYFLGGTNEN